jgi:hypothetical protein
MSNFAAINILPFWILGVPLVVAIISLTRLPRRRNIAPTDRRAHQSENTDEATGYPTV